MTLTHTGGLMVVLPGVGRYNAAQCRGGEQACAAKRRTGAAIYQVTTSGPTGMPQVLLEMRVKIAVAVCSEAAALQAVDGTPLMTDAEAVKRLRACLIRSKVSCTTLDALEAAAKVQGH